MQAKHSMGLRDLYAALLTPGKSELRTAQEALDQAAKQAYGFSKGDDLSVELLKLNLAIAAEEVEPAAPGIPPGFTGGDLLSDDCIKP